MTWLSASFYFSVFYFVLFYFVCLFFGGGVGKFCFKQIIRVSDRWGSGSVIKHDCNRIDGRLGTSHPPGT